MTSAWHPGMHRRKLTLHSLVTLSHSASTEAALEACEEFLVAQSKTAS